MASQSPNTPQQGANTPQQPDPFACPWLNPFGAPQIKGVAPSANIASRIGTLYVIEQHANSKEALELLETVAAKVTPILNARKWRIQYLMEWQKSHEDGGVFIGTNISKGYIIRVRLRKFDDPSRLAPETDVLSALLHELVHIEISGHDMSFYNLLDELRAKYGLPMAREASSARDKLLTTLGNPSSHDAFYDSWGLGDAFKRADQLSLTAPNSQWPQPQDSNKDQKQS